MSTTLPIAVTVDRLIEFHGLADALCLQELGRLPTHTAGDPVAEIILLQALQGQTGEQIQAWLHDQPEAIAYRTKPVPPPLPDPPTREAMLSPRLTFQGLIFDTAEFGRLPGFEACLPWLTPQDRQVVYAAKRAAGDTHCIITIPDGVPLYDEPNQAYSPDKFGPLDWTQRNTLIDPQLPALIREVIAAGFSKILLYLGGDGGGDAYRIAYQQLDLLQANDDYRTTLYKYCVVLPGWDGVFYGWPLEQIEPWAAKFRAMWPDGYLGLHYSCGHIPLGEGGSDFKPGGRMRDFDLLVGEFDDQLHQDSTWQILNRLEPYYVRPADQPSGDDPARVYYLGDPSPRGRWGHFAMEFGEYEAVRCGQNFDGMVAHVNTNRAYMRSMGVAFVG